MNLSREDISKYRNSGNERIKHSIEKKSLQDDFDADALEGWSGTAMTGTSMKNLDKKFLKKNYFLKFSAALTIVTAVTVGLILLNQNSESKKSNIQANEPQLVSYEKTDIVLPERIEEMDELPKKEQISIHSIKKDFEAQKQQEPVKPESSNEDMVVDLPTKPIEEEKMPDKPIRETLFGKEIYLNDLKVLDYRAYRSKPSIQTKQLELTGTPANQSEPGQTNEDEFTWKNVDVPYIDYLEKSMDIFARGNNKKALARFEEVLKTYPDDINALFYAGLCYYNLNEFDKAISSFEKCLDSKYTNFNEEAYWYIAKALLTSGDKVRAKQILNEIRDAGGYYSKQAEKLLKQ